MFKDLDFIDLSDFKSKSTNTTQKRFVDDNKKNFFRLLMGYTKLILEAERLYVDFFVSFL